MIFSRTIGTIRSEEEFNHMALEAFRYQLRHNVIYNEFAGALGCNGSQIRHYSDIPFLPVEFFKSARVYAAPGDPEVTFRSSGTTGAPRSVHPVADGSLYRSALLAAFSHFYGAPSHYVICALTPSPRENPDSSLAWMIETWIQAGAQPGSGFYLNEPQRLAELSTTHCPLPTANCQLPTAHCPLPTAHCPLPTAHCPLPTATCPLPTAHCQLPTAHCHLLLIGLTHALLDFAERYPMPLPGAIIMETGGMKGARREMVREELHGRLQAAFSAGRIHSEYGMSELLSQAYSTGHGRFRTPPWMKILIRDPNDPLSWVRNGRTGGINVIDLANRFSCPFLATQDLGRMHDDGSFEVLGRFDYSDLRGCNLLYP